MKKSNRGNPSEPAENIPLCGVLLIDKPAGPTSHDVVYQIRRLTGIKKVGHAGTLDPFATGLLIMLLGKATRLFDLLAPLEKEYEVEARFGFISSTGDVDGEIEPVSGAVPVTRERLLRVLPEFTGTVTQRPHRYSAVKIDGEPLYRRTRRGETALADTRQVQVRRLEMLDFDEASQSATMRIACSSGTYIRSLCEDIATSLDTGAYASALRRTAIGKFRADAAETPSSLESMSVEQLLGPGNPSFISCLGALYFLPVKQVDEKEARAIITGRSISGDETTNVRIDYQGRLLAVYGPAQEKGLLRPLVVLA